jgi:hypothetical protein
METGRMPVQTATTPTSTPAVSVTAAGGRAPQPSARAGAPAAAPAAARSAHAPAVGDELAGQLARAVRRRARTPSATLQRTPIWLRDGVRDVRVTHFAESVERRVLSAYGFVLANPSLGAHAALSTRDSDGHIGQWLREWAAGGAAAFPWAMFHANAGYAIESLATFLSLGDAPVGTYAMAQVVKGNTRPDLVLYDTAGTELGWLDITARRSAGHVEAKAGDWLKPANAEILYPSFTDSDFAVMQANDVDPTKPMQMGTNVRLLLATGMTRNRIELEEQELRREYLKDHYLILLRKALEGFSAAKKRKMTVDYFKDAFPGQAADLTAKSIASMLYAAGATVSVYLPATASVGVPKNLSKRAGDQLLAELAAAAAWDDVTLSAARKSAIRQDIEEELFRTSGRTRPRPVDDMEATREDTRAAKRRHVEVPWTQGRPPKPRPGLERAGSVESWF